VRVDFVLPFLTNLNTHVSFWHNQRPDWLANNPFNFTVAQLNKTIIPTAVETVIEGLGKSLISWDVVNEPLYFLHFFNLSQHH
jgi:GH35 family endo-1,4-beta-xylanase